LRCANQRGQEQPLQTQVPTIAEIFGPTPLKSDLGNVADRLADEMLKHHWHVDQLSWATLPPLPIATDEKSRRLIRFYKSVVAVQTRAEEIAVSIARRLLVYANEERLPVSLRRAIAAVLNDEASHVATMVMLETLADSVYPQVRARPDESPLFTQLMPAIETLEPAVLAIFMAAYEAAIAIRSYTEQQTYRTPSILSEMGAHAAEDDGRHAKTLRIVAQAFLDLFRTRYGNDDRGESTQWRSKILEPFSRFWTLMPDHEFYLAGSDPRQVRHIRGLLEHDIAIMTRILNFLNVSPEAQAYAQVCDIIDKALC
jgi:hypothetical protein